MKPPKYKGACEDLDAARQSARDAVIDAARKLGPQCDAYFRQVEAWRADKPCDSTERPSLDLCIDEDELLRLRDALVALAAAEKTTGAKE